VAFDAAPQLNLEDMMGGGGGGGGIGKDEKNVFECSGSGLRIWIGSDP